MSSTQNYWHYLGQIGLLIRKLLPLVIHERYQLSILSIIQNRFLEFVQFIPVVLFRFLWFIGVLRQIRYVLLMTNGGRRVPIRRRGRRVFVWRSYTMTRRFWYVRAALAVFLRRVLVVSNFQGRSRWRGAFCTAVIA